MILWCMLLTSIRCVGEVLSSLDYQGGLEILHSRSRVFTLVCTGIVALAAEANFGLDFTPRWAVERAKMAFCQDVADSIMKRRWQILK